MTTRRLLAAICTALVLQSSVGIADALPSRSGTQQELDRLAVEIAKLDEEYNLARIELNNVQHEIRDLEAQRAKAATQLEGLRNETSRRAVAVYRAGLPNTLIALFASESMSEFGRRMGIISQIDTWETKLMESLEITQQRYEHLSASLQDDLVRQESITNTINARRKSLDAKVAQQEAALRQIDSAERARRLAAARPVVVPTNLPASGRARTAVQAAYEQIGKPYRYGAAGPDAFDCSGLTMFVWRKAGVSLPHSSRAQFSATKRVARDALQPGDLVFFGSPIHHVGIYIGDGNMINSPETGDLVRIRSISRRDYAGAGRPGV